MTTTFAPRPAQATPGQYLFPRPEIVTLSNGLRIEHFPTRDQLITITLVVRGGTNVEPKGKEGLASLAADLRSEGTSNYSGEEFSTALDLIGATLNSSVTDGASTTTVQVPQSGLAKAMQLLSETVISPVYPQDEFDRLRTENLLEAKRQFSDPGNRAEIELRGVLFSLGDRAAVSRIGTVESLTAITRGDVVAFDRENLSPSAATLIIGGLIDTDLRELVEAAGLGRWTGQDALADVKPAEAPSTGRVVIIDRPESVQTEIRLGVIAVDAADPSFVGLRVASQVLGGSMNSRLSATLREEKGYTYGVGSAAQKLPARSRFIVATSVDSQSAAAAIADMMAIVDRFRAEGPTDAETERSRDEMLLGAALAYQSAPAVVRERADQISVGLDIGWFDTHRFDLDKVSAAQAHAVFADIVTSQRLNAVFIGDASGILETVQKIWGADSVEVRAF